MRALPKFSIIVPTFARPERLADCCRALARLEYPRDRFEAIVVDDGGGTCEDTVASFRECLSIKVLVQPHAGPAVARNTGARRASGEFLAFTDDDCAPASDWLKSLAARLAVEPDCAIGGRTVNALPQNVYSTASQLLVDYLYAYYNANSTRKTFFASNNFAVPAERFRAIGGFDTRFSLAAAEDRDLCDRWLSCGYRMDYAPEVLVYHSHALKLGSFCRQHFNYGRGAACFHRMRARRNGGPIELEPMSFYLDLLGYPFHQSHSGTALSLAALLAVSQGANATGYFWQRAAQAREQGVTPEAKGLEP